MIRPLKTPWTSRRNGSSNRKKPMSRLKIGSVIEAVGENGTRWIHSRTVSQAPLTDAPMISAISSARPPSTQPA